MQHNSGTTASLVTLLCNKGTQIARMEVAGEIAMKYGSTELFLTNE
jgi:hypothetical protein